MSAVCVLNVYTSRERKKREEKLAQAMGCISDQHSVGNTEWFECSETESKICVRLNFQVFAFRQDGDCERARAQQW